MYFVLQTEAHPGIIGGRGGGIGFAQGDGGGCQSGTCPITPSVIVELDTWDNSATVGINDIAAHHVAIHRNGSQSSTNTLAGPVALKTDNSGVVDGANHTVCVTWDVSLLQYTVYFDGVLRTTYSGDIRTPFGAGATAVWWGFTAATGGGAANTHRVTSAVMTTGVTSPSCAVALPVELLQFKASNEGRVNHIEWITAYEKNNDFFTLEKSHDSIEFTALGVVKALQDDTILVYTYEDYNPFEGFTYYKLSQTDINAEKRELGIVVVAGALINDARIVKNPFENNCLIHIQSRENTFCEIHVTDVSGRVVYSNNHRVLQGSNEINLDFGKYVEGMYYIQLSNKNVVRNFKVNKMRL